MNSFASLVSGIVITLTAVLSIILLLTSTIANSRLEYIVAVSGGGMLLGFLGLIAVVDIHLSRIK